MSQHFGQSGSKKPATIKIAAKEAVPGAADPGPGDPSAAPSVAPQLVDIPDPPTSSQLVVKSTNSRKIATLQEGQSGAVVHDEDEEGEGEVEHPDEATGPGGTPVSPSGASQGAPSSASQGAPSRISQGAPSRISQGAPSRTSQGAPSRTSQGAPSRTSQGAPSSASPGAPSSASPGAPSSASQGAPSSETRKGFGGMGGPSSSSVAPSDKDKKNKKVTKFRYHKRITVRTSGKTSPTQVMDKVNKKDHRAGITPSQIEEMDPQELMKRAGIKANKKTHWRVRLRQTKRLTKGGKTTTQTKIAYRDSEGNKRIKTTSSPFCKTCGKKLEECRCEPEDSQKD